MQEPAVYREDIAYIHDVGFGNFARQSAPGLLEILKKSEVLSGLVVDLGCGSGIWARELIAAGYAVLGIDYSAAMLEIARQRVPEAAFQRASFLDAELPPCQAMTALGEVFNYLFDQANSQDALAKFFSRVHDALQPGGVLAFDIAEPGRGGGAGQRQRNLFGEDWAILLETEEDSEEGILTRRITAFRRIGEVYRRSDEVHRVRLYRGARLAAMLRQLGFRTRLVRGYGSFRFPKSVVGIVARKTPS